MRQRGGCGCGALHRQDRILQPKLRFFDDSRHSADSPAVYSALPLRWVELGCGEEVARVGLGILVK